MKLTKRAWLFALCSSASLAQDPILTTLTKLDVSAVAWANIIVVIGLFLLGCKFIFSDRHDHSSVMSTIVGAIFLLGARGIASYFLPTAAP